MKLQSFTQFIVESDSHGSTAARLKHFGLHPKEYTFEYAYWYGEDDYDFDTVTVTAFDELEARDLAYQAARLDHRHVRTSKEKFDLIRVS